MLAVFSDNHPLTKSELLDAFMIVSFPESINENHDIAILRRSHEKRLYAVEHLRKLGLPPIISSFDYEILRLQGLVE